MPIGMLLPNMFTKNANNAKGHATQRIIREKGPGFQK